MSLESKNFPQYWATLQPSELISELAQKVSDFDLHVDTSGRWLKWRDLYYNYYLVNEQNYLFPNYGADGFKRLNINHFRAMLKHLLSLVTSQRVAPTPIATNSDYKSQAQVDFCKNILRYVEKEKHLETSYEKATEIALLLGCAYIAREWDATLGEVYGVDPTTQVPQRKGDVVISTYNPLDCIFDFAGNSWDDCNYVILRRYFNRWDLIAKFPQYEDQLKSISVSPVIKRHRLGHIINEKNDDLIPLYTFYHKKTPILPNGRATLFVDENTCLFDGDLPYKRIPVSRIAADDQINSPFPYSVSMDLLPVQKVYNALCSIICTNQAAFGVQNLLIPRECAIALAQLTEGLNAIYYDPQVTGGAKPEPLNLLATAPEVFKWIEYLESMMAKISGVNDTIQGNPAANLKSGTALAFVAAQALTFISPLSRSYNALLEDTWTGIIDILKEFATTARMVLVSGLSNRSEAKEFTNKDIAEIDRVIVEAGNPLTQTLAGRIQIAQDLVQAGLINKEEYMTVFQTGQLEPIYAYEKAELLCIKSENETLQDGKPAKAMSTDNHPLHIREHLTLMSTPDARMAPNNPVMVNTMTHIAEHLSMWRNMDPAIAALQNIPPCPPPAGMLPPGAPQVPPQAAPPAQGSKPRPGERAPGPGEGAITNPTGAHTPAAPSMPKLPKGTDQVTAGSAANLPVSAPPPMPR